MGLTKNNFPKGHNELDILEWYSVKTTTVPFEFLIGLIFTSHQILTYSVII